MQHKISEGTQGLNMPSAAQKQMDINRRLNDLLNQKDSEILRLTTKIMEFKEAL